MTRWLVLSIVLTIADLGGTLLVYHFAYDRLPDRVPIHWNNQGDPDAWTAKEDVLPTFLLWPGIMAGMIVLTVILPWLSPRSFEVERFRRVFDYTMFVVIALIAYIHAVIFWGSLHAPFPLVRFLVGGLFLFLALIGNVMGQMRRNFWMGVRTPWTLASEKVWIGTHRLSAWLFVAVGLAGMLAVVFDVPLSWCLAGLLVIAVVPIGYSLYLYKHLQRAGQL